MFRWLPDGMVIPVMHGCCKCKCVSYDRHDTVEIIGSIRIAIRYNGRTKYNFVWSHMKIDSIIVHRGREEVRTSYVAADKAMARIHVNTNCYKN